MISFHGSLNKVGVLKVQVHSKPDNETSHPKKTLSERVRLLVLLGSRAIGGILRDVLFFF